MFKKVMSVFMEVEEDGKEAPQTTNEEQTPAPAVAPTAPTTVGAVTPTHVAPPMQQMAPHMSAPVVAGVNDEMASMLFAAIDEANIEGFDYIEFRDTVNQMGNTGMTEHNKFLAVFTTASAMGLTREKLLSSIDHYVSVISSKREGFISHVEGMLEKEVQGRHDAIMNIDEECVKAQEEIAALNLKIQEAQQQKLTLQNEANTQKMEIENTRASFEATFQMVNGKLETDKKNIEMYIPNPSSTTTTTESKGE